ncbi:hypothetical protein [Candidatus Cyanaurora vandensis]|uniref:hypothetical protein n=1 Tax=Candidatus Cyanaurora vandensis TaxID=2714958 RepID=UPI002579657F|nr:hypothetical protein [Candidatus Cyanaurora vandensis]
MHDEVLASAGFQANPRRSYQFVVVRTGKLIEVYLNGNDDDDDADHEPLWRATNDTPLALGKFGWGIERESPGEVFVNWLGAR